MTTFLLAVGAAGVAGWLVVGALVWLLRVAVKRR